MSMPPTASQEPEVVDHARGAVEYAAARCGVAGPRSPNTRQHELLGRLGDLLQAPRRGAVEARWRRRAGRRRPGAGRRRAGAEAPCRTRARTAEPGRDDGAPEHRRGERTVYAATAAATPRPNVIRKIAAPTEAPSAVPAGRRAWRPCPRWSTPCSELSTSASRTTRSRTPAASAEGAEAPDQPLDPTRTEQPQPCPANAATYPRHQGSWRRVSRLRDVTTIPRACPRRPARPRQPLHRA